MASYGKQYLISPDYAKIADYTERIDKGETYWFDERASLYHKSGQYGLAIADYTQVITLKQIELGRAYAERASAHADSEQFELAVTDYTKAIELGCSGYAIGDNELNLDGQTFFSRALTYFRMTEYKLAEEDARQAMRLGTPSVLVYQLLGMIHTALGEYPSAVEDYTQALECLDPSRASPVALGLYKSRASLYLRMHRYSEAVADQEKADELKSMLAQQS